ncbi:MAG: hypothetical protein LUE92_05995 [Clostridiales bacterium]|nr:hypothetical protein [Clostridiales bacterium]
MKRADGAEFAVEKVNGKYEIRRKYGFGLAGDCARLGNDLATMWMGIAPFESMVQAYGFLKGHIN